MAMAMDIMAIMDIIMARGLLSLAMATMVMATVTAMAMVTATDMDTMDIMVMENRCIVQFLSRVLM